MNLLYEKVSQIIFGLTVLMFATVATEHLWGWSRYFNSEREISDSIKWEKISSSYITENASQATDRLAFIFDYNCEKCYEFYQDIRRITSESNRGDKLAISYIIYPSSRYKDSFQKANSAVCASREGVFESYHDALFQKRDVNTSIDDYLNIFKKIHPSNLASFKKCIKKESGSDYLYKCIKLSNRLPIDSLPFAILNGKIIYPESFDLQLTD